MKIFFCGGQRVLLEPAFLANQPGNVFLPPGNPLSGHTAPLVREYPLSEQYPAYAYGVYDSQKDYSRGYILYQFDHRVIFPGYHIQYELNGGVEYLRHKNKHNGNAQRHQFIAAQSEKYPSQERRHPHQEYQAHILVIQEQVYYSGTGVSETLHKTPIPEYVPKNPETPPPLDHLFPLPRLLAHYYVQQAGYDQKG
jgi:hypothetical protein